MTDEEKQILIGFYKHNPILWDDADPNYTNKSKKISHESKVENQHFKQQITEDIPGTSQNQIVCMVQ